MAFSFLGGIGIAYVQKKELISNSLIIGFKILIILVMFLAVYKFEMKTCAPHSRAFSHELGVQIFYFC